MDITRQHYEKDSHSSIIPLVVLEIDEEVPRSIFIPHKWVAELVDKHCLLAEFLHYVVDKMTG